jgi:hypothetical protein
MSDPCKAEPKVPTKVPFLPAHHHFFMQYEARSIGTFRVCVVTLIKDKKHASCHFHSALVMPSQRRKATDTSSSTPLAQMKDGLPRHLLPHTTYSYTKIIPPCLCLS